MSTDIFTECYGVSEKEIWEHYGYDMDEIRAAGNNGTGIWAREKAFENLGHIGNFIRFMDDKKKARIVFKYDPDYPVAVIVTTATLNV